MSGRYRIPALALVAIMASACSDAGTGPVARPSPSVSELEVPPSSVSWQERAGTLIAANSLSPLAAGRVYAALSVAQYRAVKAVVEGEPDGALRPSEVVGSRGRSAVEARRGAVAGASAQVLSFFFPSAAQALEQAAQDLGEMSPGNVHPHYTRGLEVGRAAGTGLVERTRNDRFTTPWTGSVPTGPGKWIANGPPAGATFGNVAPYFLTSGGQFRPSPPPAFGSAAFLADLVEIRGMTDNRTPAQTANAVYWNFPNGTVTPVGFWNQLASDYISEYKLDEREATRLYALMHAAMMDALIGCWEAKYVYWTIRPSQADPLITLPFGLPNHPSYPSGHSCVSAAAATVLETVLPERKTELDALVTDAGLSRMVAGIHYRFDVTAGRDLGVAVARWAIAHADLID